MSRAKVALTRAKKQWSVVRGPAAALIATLARIGWTVADATVAVNDLCQEVCFTKDSLVVVKKLVFESGKRWRWREAGLAGTVGVGGRVHGPLWKPIADLITRGKWHDHAATGRGAEAVGRGTHGRRAGNIAACSYGGASGRRLGCKEQVWWRSRGANCVERTRCL